MTTEGMTEEEKKAVKKAMDLLLHKDRTEQELAERLGKAGYSQGTCRTALQYVSSYGYLDDERYARTYLEYHKDKRSKKEIRFKLEQKGIPRDVLALVLEEYDGAQEEAAVYNQLQKKLKGRSVDELDFEEKRKVMAYLARKGYPVGVIQKVMK